MRVRRILSILVTDVAVPVAVFVVIALRTPERWTTGLVIAVVMGVALRVRSCLPAAAVVVVALAQAALVWEGVPVVGAPAVLIVLFSASLTLAPRALLIVAALAAVGLGAAEAGFSAMRGENPDVVPLFLVFAFGVAGGLAWRYYRSSAAAAAHEAAAQARLEAAEQRVALSRDLHDSIGHQLAVINLHTQVAAAAVDADPAGARAALEHAGDAARAAMNELGELVTHVRDGDEPLAPADLDTLRRTLAATGTLGSFDVDLPELPEPVTRTVFRVVQESITNAGRHAPGARVDVHAVGDGTHVDVRVHNGSASRPPGDTAGGGHGLDGLRERVHAARGSFEAEPAGDGGFDVHARVPIGGAG